MQLRYNYRLRPTPGQRRALNRAFGCARVVFNDALRMREDAHAAGRPYPTDTEVSRALTLAKRDPDRSWLGEVSAVVLQQALADLSAAYRNFFASLKGERKGPKIGPPRYRSKKDARQSIRFTANSRFRVLPNGRVRLPKIGDVRVHRTRDLPSAPSSVTVYSDAKGRVHASFVVEAPDTPLPATEHEVGVDLGLTHFATLSDGTKLPNRRWFRADQRKIRRADRALARCKKKSKNRAKAKARRARVYARVTDRRRDWLHQMSTTIVRDNQAIFVEDLNIAALGRTKMAKSVHDAGWGMFVRMLEYKAARHGRTFGRVGRWFPSTRICSTCGRVGDKLDLSIREWTCLCGSVHDRDHNAALNILAAGRADSRQRLVELVSDPVREPGHPAVKQVPAGSAA
jgi:putative transposase